MTTAPTAAEWAATRVSSVRDRPLARLALLERCYRGPFGSAPRHLPYRRAASSFMRWQVRRGVLEALDHDRPGSPWWRAVNERLLRDGCEAVASSGGRGGPSSSPAVDHWLAFVADPNPRTWYRAHNASVVAGYLEHRDLADAESSAERFFLNVVLCRVLYAHALVAAPELSLGWLRPLAGLVGDPRLGMTCIFLQLSRVLPDRYPLTGEVDIYLRAELGFGHVLDYGVIAPRLQALYEWSAVELGEPDLLHCVSGGSLIYAWPLEQREVWHPPPNLPVRMVQRLLPAGATADPIVT